MLTRRLWLSLLAAVLAANTLHAQAVNLTEAPLERRCVHIDVAMELAGKIKIKQDGKDVEFPHKASARHVFTERYLDAKDGVASKAARFYTTAESAITFNNNESSKRALGEKLRFLVAQRVKDQIVTFSPTETMTREEMELTEHFDTLAVGGLVPGKAVNVGESWKIKNHVVAALCGLDGVTTHSLEGKLESIKDGIAHLKIVGTAQGINLGADVGMIVNARAEFDVKEQRLVALEWKESDERRQGPVTPALSADVAIKLTRKAIDAPNELSDFALVKVPKDETPPSERTNILHQDAKGRFSLKYSRDWHVVSPEDGPQLILRHLERGDFIAQATITTWKKTDPAKVTPIAAFADLMAKTPGWNEDKETERKEFKAAELAKGHLAVYRIVVSGQLDGVATVQFFYLVVNPQGEQRIVTFSIVPQHVQRLGARDLELIRELAFSEK